MPLRTQTRRVEHASYEMTVIDDRPIDLRDVSHSILGLSWPATLGLISATYLLLNALFALGFMATGGVANASGGFHDAFFFSVQTMATIGYGAMFPQSTAAHVLVTFESLVGLVFTAIFTGLVFVRFSRIRGRVIFSKRAAFGRVDGFPHLCVRIGNGRSNRIFDAQFRMNVVRTVRVPNEPVMYRSEELKLVRDNAPNLARAWNLMHRLDESSPLHGASLETLRTGEAELHLAVTGTDETTLQTVHGRYVWEPSSFVWNVRLADVVSETKNGIVIDLRKFDDVTPSPM